MSFADATVAEVIVAGAFTLLALAHSALGESAILRPLFAAEWHTGEARWAVERVLRFAWHLTSITWIGIAAIVLDAALLPSHWFRQRSSSSRCGATSRGRSSCSPAWRRSMRVSPCRTHCSSLRLS